MNFPFSEVFADEMLEEKRRELQEKNKQVIEHFKNEIENLSVTVSEEKNQAFNENPKFYRNNNGQTFYSSNNSPANQKQVQPKPENQEVLAQAKEGVWDWEMPNWMLGLCVLFPPALLAYALYKLIALIVKCIPDAKESPAPAM